MRKLIPFFVLLLMIIAEDGNIYAQSKTRPLPDWIFEKPQRSNTTFYYHVEKGTGETETEARNAAYTQAFMQVALKLGIPLNTEDISEAIARGTNVRMLSQRFTIPMNVVCYFSRRNEEQGGWNYWLLCQIPELGYADRARFDDFSDCYKIDKYKEITAKRDADKKARVQSSNTRAIVASTFIPGLGQMIKGQGGAGVAFLVSELALANKSAISPCTPASVSVLPYISPTWCMPGCVPTSTCKQLFPLLPHLFPPMNIPPPLMLWA